MCTLGFVTTVSDTSLFVFRHGTELAYLLLYVDYIVLTASSDRLLRTIIDQLHSVFAMKDLGPLHFFLGIQVRRTRHGFFLHQGQYAEELLERAGMTNCKPTPTPVDTKPKVSSLGSAPATDGAHYRSIAGALQYLTLTRPDIAYAVQQLCLHMHAPCATHACAVCCSLGSRQAGIALHSRDDASRRQHHPFVLLGSRRLLGRRLGWLSRHTTLHFGLLRVPWSLAHLLVLEGATDGVPIQRGGRVPCRHQRNREVLLATQSAARAAYLHRQGYNGLTVTTFLWFTYPQILCTTNAPSMWSLMFTSSVKRWPLANCVFFMPQRASNLQM